MGNMTSSQNAALLAQWADLWGGNIGLADELVTDDFVTHVAPLPWAPDVGKTAGREALKKWISGGYRGLSPDMQFSIDVGPIADEHYMVVRWKVEGTYDGGFPGASPDAVGRKVAFTGTDIVRIEDGKFAEYWLNVDSLFFMQQIGVHEVPVSALA
jgi:predicted ester cyclase